MFFGAQKVVAFIFTLLRAGSASKATKARGLEGGDTFRPEKSSLGTLKAEKYSEARFLLFNDEVLSGRFCGSKIHRFGLKGIKTFLKPKRKLFEDNINFPRFSPETKRTCLLE